MPSWCASIPAMHWRASSDSPSGSFGSWNAFEPSSPAEAEVQVQAAAAAVVERPAEERRQLAVPLADLADEEPEQERLVGGRDRVGVPDVHLVGGVVELAAPALDAGTRRRARRSTMVVDRAGRVDRHAGAVHAVRRERHRDPAAPSSGSHR